MVDLLGERGKKNQGVQHKNCQEPALQMTAKTSGAQLSQPLKLPLRLRSTTIHTQQSTLSRESGAEKWTKWPRPALCSSTRDFSSRSRTFRSSALIQPRVHLAMAPLTSWC